jgi:hypothetical protein
MLGGGAAGTASNPTNQIWRDAIGPTIQAPGITSQASLNAQQGTTFFTTTDTQGHLATSNYGPQDINGLYAGYNNLTANVLTLANQTANLGQQVKHGFEGSAIAMAMGGATALPDNKRFSVTGNMGYFRGQYGFGALAQVRLSDNVIANAGVGGGLRYGGIGARGGLTFAW